MRMQRLGDEVGADDRADRGQAALLGDRSELILERDRDLAELALGRDLGVAGRGRRATPRDPATRRASPTERASRTARRTAAGDALARRAGARCGTRAGARQRLRRWTRARRPARGRRAMRRGSRSALGLLEVGQLLGLDLDEARGPALTATASRPCSAKTASTWSGVTFGSSKRISQLRPAGVVDRELEPRVRERRQEDEDETRDGDDQGEEIEPAPLPDDVKHARAPRVERTDGWRRGRRTRRRGGRRATACAPTPGGRPSAGSCGSRRSR